ncbi:uncharacterized protein LOC106012476 [Aplysia californica]|uniref:Palmitoyltransferase n=1 Tax=Aplysia californica TaxID=6500 RepID=A0ABM1A537_APLCA|nr:uncharacterized protein LOC106012476 [Aplysia californica]
MEEPEVTEVTSVPITMEMNRSEHDENAVPNPEFQTLSQKLKAHYEKGYKRPKADKLRNPLTPEAINRIAVPIFLFTAFATFKIGVFDVMPLIYAGNDGLVVCQQLLVAFIFSQMMINWLGIRYVDSGYSRYIRVHGQPRFSRKCLGLDDIKDTSSAKLMPLVTDQGAVNGQVPDHGSTKNEYPGPPQAVCSIERESAIDLAREAEIANSEMDKRENQKLSIKDLISDSEDEKRRLVTNSPPLVSSLMSAAPSLLSGLNGSNRNGVGPIEETIPRHEGVNDSFISPTPSTTQTKEGVVTKMYPYWSWAPCFDCGWTRPPRCHHCPVCKSCVLKRDHHCFFAGACVGYRNHRFFFVFLIWAWLGAVYATFHGFPYISIYLWNEMSWVDVVFPVSIVRYLLGYVSFQVALSVTTLSSLVYFDALTTMFIYAHCCLISWGLTTFEKTFVRRSVEIKDTRTLNQKIRAVFGQRWIMGFFLPTNFLYEPEEDPIEWPDIRVFKH